MDSPAPPGWDIPCRTCGAACRSIDRFCSQCGRRDPTGGTSGPAEDDLLTAATLIGDEDGNLESATFLTAGPPEAVDPVTVMKVAAKVSTSSRRRDKARHTKDQLDQMLEPGAVFGRRYRIQKFLGAGAMGYVCAAVDESIDEMVALKILSVPIHDEPEAFERFKLELKLARKIRHRNVVQSFDLGFADGFPFISMEYIDADNLLKHLGRQDTYAEPVALAIMRQVIRGLRAAHDLGIVHRDIKPENILVNKDSMAFITDFGIATSSDLVRRRELAGTPDYMAPEQLRMERVTPASDLYSCGVLFYRMLTGSLPYEARTLPEILDAHLRATPNAIPEELAVSATTRDLITWMLQKKAADRPQTADVVLEQLDSVLKRATARSASQRVKVLVIEHDPKVLAGMKAALEAEGFKVLAADNARDGVNLAFEQAPSIIFLDARVRGGFDLSIQDEASAPKFDQNLSGADALGVSRILRADERLRRVPLVLMTDKTLSNLDRAFEESGVADVMLKPLSSADILDAAKRAMPSL
jgi:serine/threonine protein kinase